MDTKLEYQSVASLNVNLNRQSYGPLDLSEAFTSQADLDFYRSGGVLHADDKTYPQTPYPYAGQIVSLVNNDTGAVTVYKLVPNEDTGYFDAVQIDAAIQPGDLPIASKTQLGAVKIGEGLDITAEGELSAQKLTVDQVIDATTKGSANPVSTSAVYEFTKSVSADVKTEAGKLDEALENKLSTYVQTTFIPLSAANSPDANDKLTKVSEVKTMLSALDVATQTLAAYKTIKTIGEEDGRISVTTQDIAISQDQVANLTSDLDNIRNDIADKLDASEFTQISNYTGLSAAYPGNEVVTKDDIKDLEGAMHFRGVTEDENVVDDYTGKPTDVSYYNDHDPIGGDVILRKDNAKEFIFSGIFDEDGKWRELGDESIYAKQTDLELSVENLKGEIANALTEAKTYTNNVSSALSIDYVGKIDSLRSDVSAYALSSDVTAISGSLYSKINSLKASDIWDIDQISCGNAE